jgi:hypothetical protein
VASDGTPARSDFSDNFNDNSLDTCKWTTYGAGYGTWVEQNQRLEFSIALGVSGTVTQRCVKAGTGDFSYTVDITVTDSTPTTGGTKGVWIQFRVGGTGEFYGVIWVTSTTYTGNTQMRYYGGTGTMQTYASNVGVPSGWQFRIRRVSGTIYEEYNDGGGWTTMNTDSNSGTQRDFINLKAQASPSRTIAGYYDNFLAA